MSMSCPELDKTCLSAYEPETWTFPPQLERFVGSWSEICVDCGTFAGMDDFSILKGLSLVAELGLV